MPIDHYTRQIIGYLKKRKGANIQQIAEAIGISRNTASHKLSLLYADGTVDYTQKEGSKLYHLKEGKTQTKGEKADWGLIGKP